MGVAVVDRVEVGNEGDRRGEDVGDVVGLGE